MSRTDELRRAGAKERGGGGGNPFVRFREDYAWLEGRVTSFWTGKYGDVATLTVTKASEGLAATGKDETGKDYTVAVEPGIEVNVGLNSAALAGRIDKGDTGREVHIAFEGWGETRAGQRFRMFTVLDLTAIDEAEAMPWDDDEEDLTLSDPPGEGDGLPF